MPVRKRKLLLNLSYAFLAQGVSLLLNVLVSLIVPRVFSVVDFNFWQLFIFFTGYGGMLHLGLNDGVYLRFGGEKYEELDHATLGAQLKVSFFMQMLLGFAVVAVAFFFTQNTTRFFVVCAAVLYAILANLSLFFGLLFRATNQIKRFAKFNLLYTTFLIVSVTALLVLQIHRVYWLIVLHIVAQAVALIYAAFCGRQLLQSKHVPLGRALKETLRNVKIGFHLMVALTLGTLILGVGRGLMDVHWGIEVFGRVSFALLLIKLFLVFVNQIGFVLFPVLRRFEEKEQRHFYLKARKLLLFYLPLLLLFYHPLRWFVMRWLPAYAESLPFMAVLFPLCVFEGRMKLLSTTYLKLLRKEKVMLKINALAALLSAALSVLGIWLFDDVMMVVGLMVVAMLVRALLADVYLAKQLKVQVGMSFVFEVLLVLLFTVVTVLKTPALSVSLFLVGYGVYLFFIHRLHRGEKA